MAALLPALLVVTAASAQDYTQDLAKKLSNPIASLPPECSLYWPPQLTAISVPFQFNYDSGYGPNGGDKAYIY